MNRLVVTLKQHTPLIHFQHYQVGATLRATEFKPKLDRYLIKNCFNDNFEEYKKFLIGYEEGKSDFAFKDKRALNYKVKIFNVKSRKVEDIVKFPLFFGNSKKIKDEYKKKKFVYCTSLDIEFFSFNKELIEKIIEVLPSFLMNNNFGMRQSKGFGSFFINDEGKYFINGQEYKYTSEQISLAKKLKYKFTVKIDNYKKDEYERYKYLFEKIEKFYKSLRSGIHQNNHTILPYIKLYSDVNNIQWEKDAIKQTYGNSFHYNKIKNEKYKNKFLMKDLFGLSTFENWRYQGWKISKEDCASDNKDKITRFKSPILFKPLETENGNFIVYFDAIEIDKRFLNREFKIKCDGKGKLTLKTPEQFSFREFFDYVFSQDIRDDFPEDLKEIYKEIKNQT